MVKVAPKLFHQLYTVHGMVGNYVYPLVYCLSTRKNQATYEMIFRRLKDHATELSLNLEPTRVTCDFELAAINAIKIVLPNTQVGGCLFHMNQSTWRQVQRLGLQSLYETNNEVRDSIHYLLALPFIPRKCI